MTDYTFRSDMTVELIRSMASDDFVSQAAKVSTKAAASIAESATKGFINYLVSNRHGSPFEHCIFTFYVEAPIFVWREIMRHRVASYNEESGRYKKLEPVFYVPDEGRPLQQVGKLGHYEFVAGSEYQQVKVENDLQRGALEAYERYSTMLDCGVAREVARMILPLSIYSSAYITLNARALTNFLSLRTNVEGAKFPSYPQAEIERVAESMEVAFANIMPLTYRSWNESGRVPI